MTIPPEGSIEKDRPVLTGRSLLICRYMLLNERFRHESEQLGLDCFRSGGGLVLR